MKKGGRDLSLFGLKQRPYQTKSRKRQNIVFTEDNQIRAIILRIPASFIRVVRNLLFVEIHNKNIRQEGFGNIHCGKNLSIYRDAAENKFLFPYPCRNILLHITSFCYGEFRHLLTNLPIM